MRIGQALAEVATIGLLQERNPRRSETIAEQLHDLVAAAAAHGVSTLRVFGTVACGEDRPDSDVDLLADLRPGWTCSA